MKDIDRVKHIEAFVTMYEAIISEVELLQKANTVLREGLGFYKAGRHLMIESEKQENGMLPIGAIASEALEKARKIYEDGQSI